MRRIITKESKALARAWKKNHENPSEFRAWCETFYTHHEEIARDILHPILESTETDIDNLVQRHISDSKKDIAVAMWADNQSEAIEAMLTDWSNRHLNAQGIELR
jgi:hypothetical protein